MVRITMFRLFLIAAIVSGFLFSLWVYLQRGTYTPLDKELENSWKTLSNPCITYKKGSGEAQILKSCNKARKF